jgi:hypothetical protein
VNRQSMISPVVSDDTIELELTPEQLQELSLAAELAEPIAPSRPSAPGARERISPVLCTPQPRFETDPTDHPRRWHQSSIVKMAAATIAYAAFAWWSAGQIAGQPRPAATAAARPTAVIPRPALMTSVSKPTVQVKNPFDATEVFQFPAGTSDAESHEKVAQILIQRARERQSQWEHIKPVPNLRTASLYRSP